MAVTAPLSAVIADATSFYAPGMDGETLAVILENGNHLYRDFRPALVSACPVTRTDANDRSYTVPIQPSLDNMRYRFYFVWLPQHNGTVTLRVQEAATFGGAYTDVVAATVTPAGAVGTWQTATYTGTIADTSRVLRFRMTAAGGSHYPSHIMAIPDPDTTAVPFVAPFGTTASGFRVFDDSLLRTATAPINTEWLDRAGLNARAVARDRQQCVFSFVQDDDTFRSPILRTPCNPAASSKLEMLVGQSKVCVPHSGDTWIDVRVIASTTAASTANRIRVASGPYEVLFTADSTVRTARLKIKGPVASVYVYASSQTAADETRLYAAVGLWRPGDLA